MKIKSIEATRIEYPDPITKRTPPRDGPSRGQLNSQATPMRRYGSAPASAPGNRRWMPGGARDVGCVVTLEDGSWGFGMTDYGRATAAIIDDFLAPALVGQHACNGLAAVPMIECSGPVMTEPGVPLEEKDRLPGTPVPSEGRLHPSDAPDFGLELKREWLPGFFS